MRKAKTIIACIAAMVVLVTVQSAVAQGKLQGVWKITEVTFTGPNARTVTNPQPSLLIFSKKYYSVVAVIADKPRSDLPQEKATDAQKVAAWTPFAAIAGTYEVKGTTLTFHTTVAKDPNGMLPGSFATLDFKIEGNTLLLVLKANQAGPIANPLRIKLLRLE